MNNSQNAVSFDLTKNQERLSLGKKSITQVFSNFLVVVNSMIETINKIVKVNERGGIPQATMLIYRILATVENKIKKSRENLRDNILKEFSRWLPQENGEFIKGSSELPTEFGPLTINATISVSKNCSWADMEKEVGKERTEKIKKAKKGTIRISIKVKG